MSCEHVIELIILETIYSRYEQAHTTFFEPTWIVLVVLA